MTYRPYPFPWSPRVSHPAYGLGTVVPSKGQYKKHGANGNRLTSGVSVSFDDGQTIVFVNDGIDQLTNVGFGSRPAKAWSLGDLDAQIATTMPGWKPNELAASRFWAAMATVMPGFRPGDATADQFWAMMAAADNHRNLALSNLYVSDHLAEDTTEVANYLADSVLVMLEALRTLTGDPAGTLVSRLQDRAAGDPPPPAA